MAPDRQRLYFDRRCADWVAAILAAFLVAGSIDAYTAETLSPESLQEREIPAQIVR